MKRTDILIRNSLILRRLRIEAQQKSLAAQQQAQLDAIKRQQTLQRQKDTTKLEALKQAQRKEDLKRQQQETKRKEAEKRSIQKQETLKRQEADKRIRQRKQEVDKRIQRSEIKKREITSTQKYIERSRHNEKSELQKKQFNTAANAARRRSGIQRLHAEHHVLIGRIEKQKRALLDRPKKIISQHTMRQQRHTGSKAQKDTADRLYAEQEKMHRFFFKEKTKRLKEEVVSARGQKRSADSLLEKMEAPKKARTDTSHILPSTLQSQQSHISDSTSHHVAKSPSQLLLEKMDSLADQVMKSPSELLLEKMEAAKQSKDASVSQSRQTPVTFFFSHPQDQQKSGWEISSPIPIHFSDRKYQEKVPPFKPQDYKVHYVDRPSRIPDKTGLSPKEKGELAEKHAQDHFIKLGYTLLPTKIRSNNGIDSFFVKWSETRRIQSIIIVESKFASDGKVKLGDSNKGKQMSYSWLKETIEIMKQDENPEVRETADLMEKEGNRVLDARYINLMKPDGTVKWFQFIKKSYDTRTFSEDPADLSDGDIFDIEEESITQRFV